MTYTTTKHGTLAEMFEIVEAEAKAAADEHDRYLARPEVKARLAAKREQERQAGILGGWLDADGNPIENEDEDDDDDDDEETDDDE